MSADAVRDREFGNLRWMDGHQQGITDERAEWVAKIEALADQWEHHSRLFRAPIDQQTREDWEHVARKLRELLP